MDLDNSNHKVLVLDDHCLFSEGLSLILSKQKYVLEVKTETDPQRVLDNLEMLSAYDLILVDLSMPVLNGFNFLQILTDLKINIPTIVISSSESRLDIEKSLQLGARGYITKHSAAEAMLQGIQDVLEGKTHIPEHLNKNLDWPLKKSRDSNMDVKINLSNRQKEVLNLMFHGHSNHQIASILNVSESTIKGHISSIFKILKVKNRTACVRAALKHQLVN